MGNETVANAKADTKATASGGTGYLVAGLACCLATAVAFHPNRFALAELRVFLLGRDLPERPS